MDIDLDLSQMNRLAVDLNRRTGTVGTVAAAAVRKVAHSVERDAKTFAPVDTGNLRNSISTTVTGDGRFAGIAAEVGPTAEYGVFLEFGTATMAPHAFMGPAFDRNAHVLETALLSIADDL